MLLGFMISAKNQTPLSRSGPNGDSRKSRDMQSPSQRRCELKCADSRAVTKRGLFDCEPVSLVTESVNENKCVTAAWIRLKLLTKIMESTTFESSVGK